ncbi:MAG: SpoIID/LytB domain-containing protein [Nitrospirae bacterium]|nr:MAG: SpoIID/LytB domain-containing protein [Nitrospirota bacterium]
MNKTPQGRNWQGWLLWGLLWQVVAFAGSPAQANDGVEAVTVALAHHAQAITLFADRTIVLQQPTGSAIRVAGSLWIEPVARGLRLGENRVVAAPVRVGTTSSSLTVVVRGQTSAVQRWNVTGSLVIDLERGEQGHAGLLVVNRVSLEDYVAGVVASEIDPSWHPEVLKAQAVAARTYVLYKKMTNPGQPYDVEASVQDQVYSGLTRITRSVRKAVAETKGMILTYNRRPILAAYSSTAAGPTEDARNVWAVDLPYLRGVDCPFDENSPKYAWRASIPLQDMETRIRRNGYPLGTLATMTPYSFTRAGRVNQVRILHSRGELIVSAQGLRRILGYAVIPSTQFHIDQIGRNVVLSGKGSGHAVGLCQWGAKEMAELGYRYESILLYYYPGTQLMDQHEAVLASPS